MPDNTPPPKINIQYILDRGTLLHRVSLYKGRTYKETCKLALCKVCQKPLLNTNCCVNVVHQKLSSIYVGATVQVSDSVVFKEKREDHF